MMRAFPMPGDLASEKICNHLRRVIAIAGLVLLGTTWRLWFGAPIFPRIPLSAWFLVCPAWCDGIAAGLMGLSLFFLLVWSRPRENRIAALIFTAAFLAAVLLNQHRLQPWAYEFCVLLLVMALLPASRAVFCLRVIVASIYLHSGLSKLDVTFLATHGEALLTVLTNAVGWDLASAPVGVRRAVVAMLPAGEIAIAAGLLIPKTRRFAKWASVAMHIVLLGILGPWGLGHKPGVLIWNVYFIAQNLVLFRDIPPMEPEPAPGRRWQTALAYCLSALVVLLPFLEPWGFYDHWPAWAVYASRPERMRVYVAEDHIGDLPAELVAHITEEKPADAVERFFAEKPPLKRFLIDRWSLEALNAPIYPQDRFQVGVALWLAETYELEDGIRVEIDSPADRWTGTRSLTVFEGAGALREAAGRYWWNAFPRKCRGE